MKLSSSGSLGSNRNRFPVSLAFFCYDVAALHQRMDAPHRCCVGNLGDGGEVGNGDGRSGHVVPDQIEQHVPCRIFLRDGNQFLERQTNPFEERDYPQEFVLGHPMAVWLD